MAFRVDDILKRMDERDKDYRFMAINDFFNELEKESFKLDAESERRIVNKLLDMVAHDTSGDVQGLAVKCLGPLANKVTEEQVQTMIDKLGGYLLTDGSDEVRDISSIGLKTVIGEIPDDHIDTIKLLVNRLTPRLVTCIGDRNSLPEVQDFCLDVLKDLLGRFGNQMGSLFERTLRSILPHLKAGRSAGKKRAIVCLAFLSVYLPEPLFVELITHLMEGMRESRKQESILTYASAIGSISRAVGFRFGPHLEHLIPLILSYCDHEDFADDCDIRENCFQTLEALVSRCSREVSPFLEQIEDIALRFLSYDPNYEDNSEEDVMDIEPEDDEFGAMDSNEEFGGLEYSDDDDMSWKVRKASARCICALIANYPNRLRQFYEKIAPVLVKRFKEREETVKLDIFTSFTELLRQTGHIIGAGDITAVGASHTFSEALDSFVPRIVTPLVKQMKEKSDKTRIGSFHLLRELVAVSPGCLAPYVEQFIPGFVSSLEKNASSPLKIEALVFMRTLLNKNPSSSFHPHIEEIMGSVTSAVDEAYYKINAEALRVCAQLPKVLRSDDFNFNAFIDPLTYSIMGRLEAQGIDQEVKDVAIQATGIFVSILGDSFNIRPFLDQLCDKLDNEVTRLTAVKAFETISSSTLQLDLGEVLGVVIDRLSKFLRKHNRQLKQATLTTLTVIVKNFGTSPSAVDLYEQLLKELSGLISDQDLHLANLAIRLSTHVLSANRESSRHIKENVLPAAIDLLCSSLLQGLALDAMLDLFAEMLKSNSRDLTFDKLLSQLMALTNKGELSKQSYHSIAKCIAVICSFTGDSSSRDSVIQRFVANTKESADALKLLSFYCVGEIGKRLDLSTNSAVIKNILKGFDSSSEEIKSASSISLGYIAVGNLDHYLPQILSQVNKRPKRQYLLLGSLREIIVQQSVNEESINRLGSFFNELLGILFQHTGSEEEGNRNVISECLGKLALIDPVHVLHALLERITDSSQETRACIVTAIKFAIHEKAVSVDPVLQEKIQPFLDLIKDDSILVRKAVLLMMNYIAYQKPKIIKPYLHEYLPCLYGETKIKKELIHEVTIGPFTHKVDDGLDLRKAAFECMYTMLDTCLESLDLPEFISQLKDGLDDHEDIKMLNHMILARLANKSGTSLVANLTDLVEPLRKTITTKTKEEAVKQQVERNEEMIQSALRAIHTVAQIPEIESCPKFLEFYNSVVTQGPLADKYNSLRSSQR